MSENFIVRYALALFQGLELQKIHEKNLFCQHTQNVPAFTVGLSRFNSRVKSNSIYTWVQFATINESQTFTVH